MQETFIELVPRKGDALQLQMKDLENRNISFHGYNLPELKRQQPTFLTPEELACMRSEGAIAEEKKLALHLRTQDRTVLENLERIREIALYGVDIALLITGDSFDPNQEPATCAHHVLDAVQEPLDIDIAVGADLYMPEWGRWEKKKDAMKRGVVRRIFTQPIFHPDALATVQNHTSHLAKDKVYAGITWMTHAKSRDYWQLMNNVPEIHLPTGESDDTIRRNSISQSADILRSARQQGYSSYIMPIRGTNDQLEEILNLAENIREY